MKCRNLSKEMFDEARRAMEARRRYEPVDEGCGIVRFMFNLDELQERGSILSIFSQRMAVVMFFGPYQHDICVTIDAKLADDNGFDVLQFGILRPAIQQICTWSNSSGYPYWRPGGQIQLNLNKSSICDADGLLKQFDIVDI